MNKWSGVGRLCNQPDVRYTQKGDAFANFRIAVDRRFKKEGQPTADFFNCVAFGKEALFVEKYINKGTKVALVAHIQNDDYTNKDGQKVTRTSFIVDEIEFCERKSDAPTPVSDIEREQWVAVSNMNEEELPFTF